MFVALAITLFLAVLPVSAAPADAPKPSPDATPPRWLGRVDTGAPGTFPAPRPFTASYAVSWGGLQAAHVETRCTAAEAGETQLSVKASTTGLARSLYTLDATHLSVVNRSTLHPVRLEQSEDTSGRKVTSRVDFLPDEAVRSTTDPGKKGKEPSAGKDPGNRGHGITAYPNLYDMNSALLYVRSLPMHDGDERTLAIMTANSPYLATIKVLGRNRVRVHAGEYAAIECSVALEKINKNGELEPRKGFKSAHAWLSDDADRLLVKVEAQVFVGAVSLELEKVNFTNPAAR